jgi:hypothetical protein
MTTVYPASEDSFNRPTASSSLSGHAALHDDLADAIEAIENKVGVDNSTDATSIDYKLAHLGDTYYTETEVDAALAALGNTYYTETEVDAALAAKLNSSAYTANDVLTKIKTVDGVGSGLDADLLDGNQASAFSLAHSHPYLSSTGTAVNSDKLDSLDSSQFLRSDADDTTSGRITIAKTGMGVDWTTAQLVLDSGGDSGIAIRTGNQDQYTVQLRSGGSVASIPRLFLTGDVGGGAGVVWADLECRTVQENSARRFKTNIVPAYSPTSSDAIDKVKQIPLSSFAYLDNPSETVVGVVAEDLVDVLPEAVSYRDGEVSSVATQRVTYVALGALKQAINKIEALEAKVAELEGR